MPGVIKIGDYVTARPCPYRPMLPVVQGIYTDSNPDGTINVLTETSGVIVCAREARVVADDNLLSDTLTWVKAWRRLNVKVWEVE